MNTPLARNAVRLLIVFFFAAGLIGPSQWTNAQAQNPPPGEQPVPQAADSHRMLPPAQPRVKLTAPAPFQGIKPIASLPAQPQQPEALPNLAPYQPTGWAAPVVLSDQPDAVTYGTLVGGQPFYLNMAVANFGSADIPYGSTFRIVVTVGGQIVYTLDYSGGLPAGYYIYDINILVETSISAGYQQVEITADANGQISEETKADNIVSSSIQWLNQSKANLIPYTPAGWTYPLQVTSTSGLLGDTRLYADRVSYFHIAYANIGVVTATNFTVTVRVDGVILYNYPDTLSSQYYQAWTDISLPSDSLTSGWHTVTLILDEANQIVEDNETDNTFEAAFYWETSSRANLHPYQVSGWDDALVVSSTQGTNTFDVLTAGQSMYLDWAVINDGWGDVPVSTSFRTSLTLDGTLIHSWDWANGLAFGWYLYVQDYPVTMTAGWHLLGLQTDTTSAVAEMDEYDNATSIWVYVEQALGQPEIRVEPAAITVDIAAGSAPNMSTLAAMPRDMSRVEQFIPADYGLGAEITPPTRFIEPKIPLATMTTIPTAVDHSSGLPPIGNQGNAGSCVGWSTSYYLKSYQEGVDQGWSLATANHQFSPNYVWNQIQPSSTCGGTYPANALQLIVEKGDLTLSSMAYSEDCKPQPTQQQLDAAASYRAQNYGSFFTYGAHPDNAVITTMKEWIAGGDIMQLSIPVLPEFDNPSGPYCIVDLPVQGASRGGHSITIVGYDDNIGGLGKQGFKVVNSWSTGWGCSGFAYITYDWIKSNAMESWWMRDIRTGSSTFRDFTIHNDGAGVLTVSQIAQQNTPSSWLQIVLPEALPMQIDPGASKTIQVSFNTTGLAVGSHTQNLVVTSDDADEPQSLVQVTLNYGAAASAAPPSAITPYPANGAASVPTNLTMSWNTDQAVAGVLYDLRLDTTNPPALVVCNDVSSKGCGSSSLHPNTTYYWRVVTQNAMYSTLGPVWSFTTGATTVLDKKVFLPSLRK